MENKYVGLIIIAIAIVFFFIVMSFNSALDEIVNTTCTHGEACPMHVTLKTQKIVSYSLIGLIVIIGGIVFSFSKDSKKDLKEIVTKLEENSKQIRDNSNNNNSCTHDITITRLSTT